MLLTMRAYTEGNRALSGWVARELDWVAAPSRSADEAGMLPISLR